MLNYFPLLATWRPVERSVQNCFISSALEMEILQSCTKPSIWRWRSSTSFQAYYLTTLQHHGTIKINACIWGSIRPLVTNFSAFWMEIQLFSFRKMHLEISSLEWLPFCTINAPVVSCCYVDTSPLTLSWIFFNKTRPRKMDAIFQTAFSNGFSWMKMYEFQLKFHWSLFLRV